MNATHTEPGRYLRRNRARAAMIAVSILAACGRPGGANNSESPPGVAVPAVGVVLPASEERRLLTYCDGARADADSLWTPSDSVLRAVELSLARHLRGQASPGVAAPDPLGEYSRQYVGLHRGEEKFVFVRGVHQAYLTRALTFDTQSVPQSVKVASAIRRFGETAVDVCDGGRGFFRAEYSLRAQRISRFAFQDYESR
jgi:hypothetical protein